MASTKSPAMVSTLKYSSAGAFAEAKEEVKINKSKTKCFMPAR
jgi:hypothetical protein